jgi:hypothetical protein
MDITQLILDDHHQQRRLFAVLEQIDRTNTAALGAVWNRLAAFLEVHAEAEEQLFYPELLRVAKAVREVEEEIAASNDQGSDSAAESHGSLSIGSLKKH